jgi:hypothetical protein
LPKRRNPLALTPTAFPATMTAMELVELKSRFVELQRKALDLRGFL